MLASCVSVGGRRIKIIVTFCFSSLLVPHCYNSCWSWALIPSGAAAQFTPGCLLENTSPGICVSQSRHIKHGLVTAINRDPLPRHKTFIHKSCGLVRWCCSRGMCVGVRRSGSTPPFPYIHTLAQFHLLNGKAIDSPPMACPLWNMSLIWKRHAYVFMWPLASCPRAKPVQ